MTTHDHARALRAEQKMYGYQNRLESLISAVERVEGATSDELPDALDHLFAITDYARSEPVTGRSLASLRNGAPLAGGRS